MQTITESSFLSFQPVWAEVISGTLLLFVPFMFIICAYVKLYKKASVL
jgi:uncharacterized membrane protein YjjP (DUF1212 family)